MIHAPHKVCQRSCLGAQGRGIGEQQMAGGSVREADYCMTTYMGVGCVRAACGQDRELLANKTSMRFGAL